MEQLVTKENSYKNGSCSDSLTLTFKVILHFDSEFKEIVFSITLVYWSKPANVCYNVLLFRIILQLHLMSSFPEPCLSQVIWGLGPCCTNVFPSQFKFDGNFVSLSPRLSFSDCYKILYMVRQLCCRGMCKNLLRSDGQQQNYSKGKFPSNLKCVQKIVSEPGPWLFKTQLAWHILDSPFVVIRVTFHI